MSSTSEDFPLQSQLHCERPPERWRATGRTTTTTSVKPFISSSVLLVPSAGPPAAGPKWRSIWEPPWSVLGHLSMPKREMPDTCRRMTSHRRFHEKSGPPNKSLQPTGSVSRFLQGKKRATPEPVPPRAQQVERMFYRGGPDSGPNRRLNSGVRRPPLQARPKTSPRAAFHPQRV